MHLYKLKFIAIECKICRKSNNAKKKKNSKRELFLNCNEENFRIPFFVQLGLYAICNFLKNKEKNTQKRTEWKISTEKENGKINK